MEKVRPSILFLIAFLLLTNTVAAWECPKINPAGAAQMVAHSAIYSIPIYALTLMIGTIYAADAKGDICPSSKGIASDAGCKLLHDTVVLGASSIVPVVGAGVISLAVSGMAMCLGAEKGNPAFLKIPAALTALGVLGTNVMSLYTDFNYFLNREDKLPSDDFLESLNRTDAATNIKYVQEFTITNATFNLLPWVITLFAAPFAYFMAKDTRPACCDSSV